MSHKLLDLYPKILSQSEKNLDLSKFTALALPVIPGDKVELVKSKLLKEITEFTKLNLNPNLTYPNQVFRAMFATIQTGLRKPLDSPARVVQSYVLHIS